jgi:hypothetical protein
LFVRAVLTDSNIFQRLLLNGGCLRIFVEALARIVSGQRISTAATAVARWPMTHVHI